MANRKTNAKNSRAQSRTKKVVKMIKRGQATDTMDIVKQFVAPDVLEKMPVKAQSAIVDMAAGMRDAVSAGQYDLRHAM